MRRFLVLAVVAVSLAARASAAPCSPTTFITAAEYPVGVQPRTIVVGDFTNDTEIDVASVNIEGEVSVLPGNGDGSFGTAISADYDFYYTTHTVAGFLNADVNLDLAVALSGSIAILLGNGDGSFQTPTLMAASYNPVGFVTADFSGDLVPDLGLADAYNSKILVFLGNGDGTFTEQPSIASGTVFALAAGDLDGGGTIDLVAPVGANSVAIWPGLGDGTFGLPTMLPLGPEMTSVALGDLDDDGSLDIAVGLGVYVAVFANNGDGTFQAAVEYGMGYQPGSLAPADIDGDGRTDLVVLKRPSGSAGIVSVLLQTAAGSLTESGGYQSGIDTMQFAAADFNGNGADDVAAVNFGSNTVSILLAEDAGILRAIRVAPITTPWQDFAAGDFNADGVTDFAALDGFNGGSVTVLFSDGRGRLSAGAATPLGLNGPQKITAADFNGDGNPDLSVTDFYGVMAVLLGIGDGTFAEPVSYPITFNPSTMTAGDFNGDGILDLGVLINGNVNGDIDVLLGLAGGGFGPAGSFPLAHYPAQVISADVDGNGFDDLVTANGFCCGPSDSVDVLLSNGDGTFQAPASYGTGPRPVSVAAGDFDEDGVTDLVTANSNAFSISLLSGNGSGGFGPPTLVAIGWIPSSVAVGDFDGDGHQDIVAGAQSPGSRVLLLRGLGSGGFLIPETYVVGSNPAWLFVGHFDLGSTLDVATFNSYDNSFSILLNGDLSAEVTAAVSVIVGSPAVLTVEASGFGPLTYQWRKDGVPLSDGGAISGATTATLTIDPTAFTDAGAYDVVVTDSCTSLTSNTVTLSIEFADVPLSNPFHDDIITIATAGIAVGCTDTTYCPSVDVSRAEMAVFLLKAKFGADHVPPPPGGQIFDDVPPGSFAEAWIAELAGLGITVGCGNGNYCPDAPVTRGEMAVFLLKTLLGSGYVPPPATGIFSDVPSDYFAIDWIEDLYLRGITAGCGTGPLRYCPDEAVPREQMATFIVLTFLAP